MELVEAGNTIFHYTAQHVVGVSTATSRGRPTPKPYVDRSDEDWVEEGLQIPLEYHPIDEPTAKNDIPLDVRLRAPLTPSGPFNRKGDVFLGYLFPVGAELQDPSRNSPASSPERSRNSSKKSLQLRDPLTWSR
jgi:hypothetical protein